MRGDRGTEEAAELTLIIPSASSGSISWDCRVRARIIGPEENDSACTIQGKYQQRREDCPIMAGYATARPIQLSPFKFLHPERVVLYLKNLVWPLSRGIDARRILGNG